MTDSPQNLNRLSPKPAIAGGPSRRWQIAIAVILLMLLALGGGTWLMSGGANSAEPVRISLEQTRELTAITEGQGADVLDVGDSAKARNALIPVAAGAVQKVPAFAVSGDTGTNYRNALKCMTQAIYYEAANEPVKGKRAVAQVVLNRVRHPAYPSSVCGVVYEGVNQAVCQFSFTCDGSLLRVPMARQWQEASDVAKAALAGTVETDVGTATNYHADYVVPRWAYSMGKIEQIGAHIFYRFKGNWGNARAFSGSWSGREAIPELDMNRLRHALDAAHDDGTALAVADNYVPGLTVTPHVTDRHAADDVGGRIDTTKQWRLSIPDPVAASSTYRDALSQQSDKRGLANTALADASAIRKVNP